ncbi:exported protein of unknown function [Azospirillum baldaniorum]|uniref:Uncharacterized protein n=1 Tax=Azospirillum baldaniorum TaxID=1064539 RepID=A0A9P1NLJ6_9PROT|nr:exported protein of unknown function [Azospirillum baldaniorum]
MPSLMSFSITAASIAMAVILFRQSLPMRALPV